MSFIFILLCSLLAVAHSLPYSHNPQVMLKRALVSETLCDDAQDNPINQILYQAVVLANSTIDRKLPDGTAFRHSTAYSNYFTDADWSIVSSMYKYINDFTWHRELGTPQVWFLCSQPKSIPTACKDGKKRIAFADPDPHPYTWDSTQWLPSSGIGFCSSFFDPKNPLLNRFLFSKKDEEWCKGKTWDDYYNVGFLAVELFVGMDNYGALAKIPSRSIAWEDGLYPRLNTHGAAIPANSPVRSSASAFAAQKLKKAWDDSETHGGPKPALQRVQNGPSFAAAAMEWYFLTLCDRSKQYNSLV